jgi:tetratricopeptide (TPR) repeat protein
MPKARRTAKEPVKKHGLFHLCLTEHPAQAAVPFWILAAPVLAFAAVVSYFQICSPDLWWHIKTGEWIWQQHHFPRGDPFSYTAAGQPWIAHEWLFGLIAFLAWRTVGLAGLIGLKASLVVVLLALTAWTARARGATAGMTILVLGAAYAISRHRFDERPELISLCLAVGFLLINAKSRERPRLLLLLPALQWIWVNLHGGTALLGWGLAGAFFLDQAWPLRKHGSTWHRLLSRQELRGHLGALAGVIAISFANPYTFRTLTYGAMRADSPLNIEEFQSLAARMRLDPDIAVTLLIAYAIMLTALFVLRPRQVRLFEWLLLPALLILSLSFFRFRSLFAVLLAPSLAWQLSHGKWLGRLRWWLPATASALLLIWIGTANSKSYAYRFGAGIHTGILPVEAAEFVRKSGMSGRMFNEYDFGGYLIWRLQPELKVFIDGREDVYVQPGIAREYSGRFRSRAAWQELVAKYRIDFALVKYPQSPPQSPELSLERLAFARSEWALVYFDDLAVIYARRNANNDEVIRQKEIKAVQPLQLSNYLDEIVRDPEKQRQFMEEMNANLRDHPSSFRDHFLLGIAAIKSSPQDLNRAIQEFHQASAFNPEYIPAYLNLGSIYLQLGRFSEAQQAYRKVLALEDNDIARQQLTRLQIMR